MKPCFEEQILEKEKEKWLFWTIIYYLVKIDLRTISKKTLISCFLTWTLTESIRILINKYRRVEFTGITYLISFAMNGCESIGPLHEEIVHLIIIIWNIISIPPGEQDHLTVAMDRVVEDPISSSWVQNVTDIHVLRFREWYRSVVGVTAIVMGAPTFVPVESPVSVSINSLHNTLAWEPSFAQGTQSYSRRLYTLGSKLRSELFFPT